MERRPPRSTQCSSSAASDVYKRQVLGEGETGTGDPARRAGNEFLFQMQAMQNVEMLNEIKAKKIVVTCPHCLNTLGREYPQVGGHYEVVHHSQLLASLVKDGRLTPGMTGGFRTGCGDAAGMLEAIDLIAHRRGFGEKMAEGSKRLAAWIGNDGLAVHVFIPEKMKVAPNSFFLGMADLSDGWAWVDGVFPRVEVKPGWNDIVYTPSGAMKNVKEGGHYKIYLSFFAVDESNAKVPLAEPFFVDGIRAEKLDDAGSTASGRPVCNWRWAMDDEA